MQSPLQWGLEPSLSLCLSSIGTAAPCNFDQCSWMNPNRQFCCIRLLEKSILHGCAPSLFTAFWPLTGLIRLWITTKPLCPTNHGKGRSFSRRFLMGKWSISMDLNGGFCHVWLPRVPCFSSLTQQSFLCSWVGSNLARGFAQTGCPNFRKGQFSEQQKTIRTESRYNFRLPPICKKAPPRCFCCFVKYN